MKKTLLVYYSYTNNTKKIAEAIKEKIDCDILRLTPLDKYSDNYQEVVDQGYLEVENKEEPELDNDLNIVSQYYRIIIGSPIWWYHIAPVVRTFLHEANLDSKEIIPFITNGGYGLGHSKTDIKGLCKKSKINNIFEIPFEEDKMQLDETSLNKWIETLK